MLSFLEIPMTTRTSRTSSLVLSLAMTLAGPRPAAAAETTVAATAVRDPAAEAAYAEALVLVEHRNYMEAIARLDLATELEPTWSDPVRLRAAAFGALADRYHPSAAFMSARMADLQRLLALEPGVDTEARQQEVAALSRQSRTARKIEQSRRDLAPWALALATVSGALLISGTMLYSMMPNDFLKPTAYRHERRNAAGLSMLVAGVVVLPHAIMLGVLSGRQARRDSALRNLEIQTGRPRAAFGVTPQLVRGGGAMGFSIRF